MGGVSIQKKATAALKGKKAMPASKTVPPKEEEEEEEMSSSEEEDEEEEASSSSSSEDSDDSDAGHHMGRKAMFKRQLQTGKASKNQKKKAKLATDAEKESTTAFKNRQRVLVVASRGVTERYLL